MSAVDRLARLAPFCLVAILALSACGDESRAGACSYDGVAGEVYTDVTVSGGASCAEVLRDVFRADEERPLEGRDCTSRFPSRPGKRGRQVVTCQDGDKRVVYVERP